MKLRIPARACQALGALVIAFNLPAANAALIDIGGGDSTGTNFYRGLALVWNNPNGSGGVDGNDLFGQSYTGNFGPGTVYASEAITRTGSTVYARSQAVSAGWYASRNYAEIDVRDLAAGNSYYAVGGTGSKTVLRVDDPSALAQRATFNWRVTGASTLPAGVTGDATSRLDFGWSTDPNSDWYDLFSNPTALNAVTYLGAGNYSVTVPLVLGQPLYVHYWSSAFTQIDPGEAPVGGDFLLRADFYSTFVLEDIVLFDADDNLLSDWTILDDDSGELLFDAAGRIAAIEESPPLAAVVPLPGSVWLLLTAVGAVAARKRIARSTR